jgi:rod shape-determining protein MreD
MGSGEGNSLQRVEVTHGRRRVQSRSLTTATPHTGRMVAAEIGRLALMLVVTILLQTTIAAHVRVLGAGPDFALLAVVAVGLLRGSEIGALFGFVVGVGVAVTVFGPLGLSSLVLVVVGYFAGRYAETADSSSGWTPVLAVLAGTMVAQLLATAMQFLLDRQTPFGFVVLRVFLPSLILNGLLAAPIYLLTRLWLREGVSDRE